jgi:hypothetical protein
MNSCVNAVNSYNVCTKEVSPTSREALRSHVYKLLRGPWLSCSNTALF